MLPHKTTQISNGSIITMGSNSQLAQLSNTRNNINTDSPNNLLKFTRMSIQGCHKEINFSQGQDK